MEKEEKNDDDENEDDDVTKVWYSLVPWCEKRDEGKGKSWRQREGNAFLPGSIHVTAHVLVKINLVIYVTHGLISVYSQICSTFVLFCSVLFCFKTLSPCADCYMVIAYAMFIFQISLLCFM